MQVGFQNLRRGTMNDWIQLESILLVLLAVTAGITTIGTV
jgi:hypothetical protein